MKQGAIGVFDSGYGGLTILSAIRELLPQYDYIYLGDNARAPYGSRSFELIQEFTLEAVKYLFSQGCPLVILACNTASAKALRYIQQNYLPISTDPSRRVLGIIRPTAERIGEITENNKVGLLATSGTVASGSYPTEVHKLYPQIEIYQKACPMWVPLVEYGQGQTEGADFFIRQDVASLMQKDEAIDTIVLGCTHYPILENQIKSHLPKETKLISQGSLVAESLKDYLERHPEMEGRLTKKQTCRYLTTEHSSKFDEYASMFTEEKVRASQVKLD